MSGPVNPLDVLSKLVVTYALIISAVSLSVRTVTKQMLNVLLYPYAVLLSTLALIVIRIE